ncbi:hypothetical protein Anas_01935 [Armadillidium nasatum]|uniref:PKD/REJ-like domain-containing protein n=1 Tax=Armadillidium nasatum TaxID=96803 RepID=A0A5N5SJL1_9CRUS|nr:hypothetical protein Anas_01935 [Armadillidium nasatum]
MCVSLCRWTCRRAEGGGCYVIENKKPKRFENAISKEDLNKPILNIPPLLLLQDKYVMKVTVRNRHGDSATAMVNVEIVSGYLPYLSLNMTSQLVAHHSAGQEDSYADIVITKKSPPVPGKIEVNPSQGEGLMTSFVFSATGWRDIPMDLPFTASFGYVFSSSADVDFSRAVWFGKAYGDELSSTTFLPSGIEVNPSQVSSFLNNFMWLHVSSDQTKILPVVRVCDNTMACTFLKGESAVTVTPPTDISMEKIRLVYVQLNKYLVIFTTLLRELGSILESKLEDNSLVEGAIREVTMVMKTLKAIGDEEKIKFMMDIIENRMMIKIQELKVSLQRNAEAASASLGMLYSSTFLNDVHYLQRENYDQLGSLQGHFMAYIRNETSSTQKWILLNLRLQKTQINVNVGGGDILNASVGGDNVLSANVGDGDILSASVGGDELLNANVGGGVLSASVGGDNLLNVNGDGGGLLDINLGIGKKRRKRQSESTEEVKPMTAEEMKCVPLSVLNS